MLYIIMYYNYTRNTVMLYNFVLSIVHLLIVTKNNKAVRYMY